MSDFLLPQRRMSWLFKWQGEYRRMDVGLLWHWRKEGTE